VLGIQKCYLGCVWIPAQDPVVLPAAQEQLGISQAPVDGKHASVDEGQHRRVSKKPLDQ